MIGAADYRFFRTFLKERSGLELSDDKQYLLETRLPSVIAKFGIGGFTQLAARLKQAGTPALEEAVVEAMTTNESFFFRDKTPFEAFTDFMLPTLLRRRSVGQRIRIWCAAAASGQEPYSLAMLLHEQADTISPRRIEIVATDISNAVLGKARAGTYTQFEVQRGLPVNLLLKHFRKDGEAWVISPDIRKTVDFRRLNLMEPFAHLGMFDIVFCRNVLIYFDQATKTDVLARIAASLRPDGYLVLGGAETVIGLSDNFAPAAAQRSIYTLKARAAQEAMPAAIAPELSPVAIPA